MKMFVLYCSNGIFDGFVEHPQFKYPMPSFKQISVHSRLDNDYSIHGMILPENCIEKEKHRYEEIIRDNTGIFINFEMICVDELYDIFSERVFSNNNRKFIRL